MTVAEIEAYAAIWNIPHELKEIRNQLKIANQLKALELKAKYPELTGQVEYIEDSILGIK